MLFGLLFFMYIHSFGITRSKGMAILSAHTRLSDHFLKHYTVVQPQEQGVSWIHIS